MKGRVNPKQEGWVEGRHKTNHDDLEMLFSVSSSLPTIAASKLSTITNQLLDSLQLQAAAEYKQSLVAVRRI